MSIAPPHRLRLAARALRRGGVIAYPTEAVYGLGCDPWSQPAVMRLLSIKQRPVSKGLILLASKLEQLLPFVELIPGDRMDEIASSWPGPNTWLLPARPGTPRWLTGRFDTLAVRVTAHPLACALCDVYGGAIVSTSANRARRPPARSSLEVRLGLGAQLDDILVGQCIGASRPSTIRDGRTGRVLRI
ncbi:Sua5/YciO/YrdC/YwlC family protein [Thiocystis violacea]|uniref:Sua5/YciO/YrdC/YwlC family protein n=1 Tax=Thiocystis violacea TaxID=13725 RepID=UPI001905F177|nr:Sua5/YciO/YrdC/YwlC family protein [Thiocystis violacea]MBK1722797.1 tRNA threonylcarbamoyladenosine biosynthesis protein RimN [Thiocystis violacea]